MFLDESCYYYYTFWSMLLLVEAQHNLSSSMPCGNFGTFSIVFPPTYYSLYAPSCLALVLLYSINSDSHSSQLNTCPSAYYPGESTLGKKQKTFFIALPLLIICCYHKPIHVSIMHMSIKSKEQSLR